MTQAAQKHESQSPSHVNSQSVCKLYFCPLEAEAIGLNEAIVVAGMPEWMRITPTVKAAAVRMWLDEGASGGGLKVAFTDIPWMARMASR